MAVVLGIDAAWTMGHPSGVALLDGRSGCPRLLAVSASYEGFLGGRAIQEHPPVLPLLDAAEALADAPVDVVAVDMPLAVQPFAGRRKADNDVSRAFGSAGCSTHSPTAQRPGPISAVYTARLAERGFRLATTGQARLPALLEVYPHIALLRLCGRPRRLPYKLARAARYWPDAPVQERRRRLLAEWQLIRGRLGEVIEGLEQLALPEPGQPRAAWKGCEDTLDAVVCAWVGQCFARGRAEAFGDETAAIWMPSA